jgi:hypothetical protein
MALAPVDRQLAHAAASPPPATKSSIVQFNSVAQQVSRAPDAASTTVTGDKDTSAKKDMSKVQGRGERDQDGHHHEGKQTRIIDGVKVTIENGRTTRVNIGTHEAKSTFTTTPPTSEPLRNLGQALPTAGKLAPAILRSFDPRSSRTGDVGKAPTDGNMAVLNADTAIIGQQNNENESGGGNEQGEGNQGQDPTSGDNRGDDTGDGNQNIGGIGGDGGGNIRPTATGGASPEDSEAAHQQRVERWKSIAQFRSESATQYQPINSLLADVELSHMGNYDFQVQYSEFRFALKYLVIFLIKDHGYGTRFSPDEISEQIDALLESKKEYPERQKVIWSCASFIQHFPYKRDPNNPDKAADDYRKTFALAMKHDIREEIYDVFQALLKNTDFIESDLDVLTSPVCDELIAYFISSPDGVRRKAAVAVVMMADELSADAAASRLGERASPIDQRAERVSRWAQVLPSTQELSLFNHVFKLEDALEEVSGGYPYSLLDTISEPLQAFIRQEYDAEQSFKCLERILKSCGDDPLGKYLGPGRVYYSGRAESALIDAYAKFPTDFITRLAVDGLNPETVAALLAGPPSENSPLPIASKQTCTILKAASGTFTLPRLQELVPYLNNSILSPTLLTAIAQRFLNGVEQLADLEQQLSDEHARNKRDERLNRWVQAMPANIESASYLFEKVSALEDELTALVRDRVDYQVSLLDAMEAPLQAFSRRDFAADRCFKYLETILLSWDSDPLGQYLRKPWTSRGLADVAARRSVETFPTDIITRLADDGFSPETVTSLLVGRASENSAIPVMQKHTISMLQAVEGSLTLAKLEELVPYLNQSRLPPTLLIAIAQSFVNNDGQLPNLELQPSMEVAEIVSAMSDREQRAMAVETAISDLYAANVPKKGSRIVFVDFETAKTTVSDTPIEVPYDPQRSRNKFSDKYGKYDYGALELRPQDGPHSVYEVETYDEYKIKRPGQKEFEKIKIIDRLGRSFRGLQSGTVVDIDFVDSKQRRQNVVFRLPAIWRSTEPSQYLREKLNVLELFLINNQGQSTRLSSEDTSEMIDDLLKAKNHLPECEATINDSISFIMNFPYKRDTNNPDKATDDFRKAFALTMRHDFTQSLLREISELQENQEFAALDIDLLASPEVDAIVAYFTSSSDNLDRKVEVAVCMMTERMSADEAVERIEARADQVVVEQKAERVSRWAQAMSVKTELPALTTVFELEDNLSNVHKTSVSLADIMGSPLDAFSRQGFAVDLSFGCLDRVFRSWSWRQQDYYGQYRNNYDFSSTPPSMDSLTQFPTDLIARMADDGLDPETVAELLVGPYSDGPPLTDLPKFATSILQATTETLTLAKLQQLLPYLKQSRLPPTLLIAIAQRFLNEELQLADIEQHVTETIPTLSTNEQHTLAIETALSKLCGVAEERSIFVDIETAETNFRSLFSQTGVENWRAGRNVVVNLALYNLMQDNISVSAPISFKVQFPGQENLQDVILQPQSRSVERMLPPGTAIQIEFTDSNGEASNVAFRLASKRRR